MIDDAQSLRAAGIPRTVPDATSGTQKALVTAAFFVSGAASLILQVLWFKQLQFVLGSTTISVSVTVASFFFGLSVGSAFGGRAADAVARPLRIYGLLELSLAVVSFIVTTFLTRWPTWAAGLVPLLNLDSPVRLPLIVLLSLATLSLPTMLMGATLPFLARYLTRSRAELANRVGSLYGFNTLGAAVGTFAAGFILMGLLGITGTSLFASMAYVLIGGSCLIAARRERALTPAVSEPTSAHSDGSRDHSALLIWVFACSGFVSIGYEVIWFRVLTNLGTASVFAFAGMLGTYLLGLVIGAFLCARLLAPQKADLLRYFANLQLGIAIAATLSIAVLGKGGAFRALLSPVVASIVPLPAQMLLGGDVPFFLICMIALLLPTTLIGIGFPLASELTVTRMAALGRRIGTLYALNTVGGVLGSLTAGFILIPYLGSQWALTALISVNLVLFVAIAMSRPGLLAKLWRPGVLALGVVVLSTSDLGAHYLQAQLTAFDGAKVLELREAREATYAVLGYQDAAAGTYEQLVVNSKSYASNRPEGRRYMAAMAHFPLLLHAGPSASAVIICIGTGTTVGALTTHDELKSIDAVDLAPTVFDFAHYFVPINKRFYANPRVHKIAADGRNYLLGTQHSYDVITLEPPPPHDAGVVNLYTEEFYALAKRRMRPGAVLAQWAPMDIGRGALSKMIVKAMLKQFRHVSLWLPDRMEGIVIASDEPLRIDYGVLSRRMFAPMVANDLAAIGINAPEDLLATFVAADEKLAAYLNNTPTLTDDRPRIEYYNFYPDAPIRMKDLEQLREPVEHYLTGAGASAEERLDLSRNVVEDIWEEHEATVDGDANAARSAVAKALRLEPGNQYLRFLARKDRAATWAVD